MTNGSIILEDEDRPHFTRHDVPYYLFGDSVLRDEIYKHAKSAIETAWESIKLTVHKEDWQMTQEEKDKEASFRVVPLPKADRLEEGEITAEEAASMLNTSVNSLGRVALTNNLFSKRKKLRVKAEVTTSNPWGRDLLRTRVVFLREQVVALSLTNWRMSGGGTVEANKRALAKKSKKS